MFVADPLLGPFVVPDRFERLLRAPEVQRLREVRLINTTTPSLAGLSDVRRFTHTLAVLHLAHRVTERLQWTWPQRALDTLLVAAIVHDVGSPAFAHLFEYLLKSKYAFSHEAMLKSVISGDYKRTNLFHQVYYGGQLALRACIEELDVDSDEVVSYVLGQAPLGTLIAGTLDIDNLDNVYRMAAGLGLKHDIRSALQLVDHMTIDYDSGRLVVLEDDLQHVENWRQLRRKSYEILAFDEQALASQAMLTDCLAEAVQRDLLAEEDWFLTDEQMLRRLIELNDKATVGLRETVMRFATADYFSPVFIGWYQKAQGERDLRLPEHRAVLRDQLETALDIPISPYVFYDKGTFEKRLLLQVAQPSGSNARTEIGELSTSTIVSVFTSQRLYRPSRRAIAQVHEILAQYGLPSSSLLPLPDKQDVYGFAGRTQLAF
jgi:hypothetical protein